MTTQGALKHKSAFTHSYTLTCRLKGTKPPILQQVDNYSTSEATTKHRKCEEEVEDKVPMTSNFWNSVKPRRVD